MKQQKIFNFSDKKGISVMIGYILLISAAVMMGTIVYQWMKTYVPKDGLGCPDGVSLFIEDATCNSLQLNLTLKNNGRFSVAGYFIHAANVSVQELATIDLSSHFLNGGTKLGSSIIFAASQDNAVKPADTVASQFNLTLTNEIYLIQITPVMFNEQNNKIRFVSCGSAKITQEVSCV